MAKTQEHAQYRGRGSPAELASSPEEEEKHLERVTG